MKKRELMLLIALLLFLGVGFYLISTPEDQGGGTDAALAGDLDSARAKFEKNLETLKQGKKINAEYQKLALSLDDSHTQGIDPGMAAQTQLYDVLSKKLGIATPVISNSVPKDIPNVQEYYFINITFKVSGSELEMKKLLTDVEALGYLIQSFKLNQPNHGQADYVDMEVVVSKLVKNDKPRTTRTNRLRR